MVAIAHPYDAGAVEFPGGRLERQRFADPPSNRAVMHDRVDFSLIARPVK